MTTLVQFICDRKTDSHSLCARKSLPRHSVGEAREAALQDGWHLRQRERGGDLCPDHSGRKP